MLAPLPNGSFVSASSDNTIRVWHPHVLALHGMAKLGACSTTMAHDAFTVAVLPDGRVASGDYEGLTSL